MGRVRNRGIGVARIVGWRSLKIFNLSRGCRGTKEVRLMQGGGKGIYEIVPILVKGLGHLIGDAM